MEIIFLKTILHWSKRSLIKLMDNEIWKRGNFTLEYGIGTRHALLVYNNFPLNLMRWKKKKNAYKLIRLPLIRHGPSTLSIFLYFLIETLYLLRGTNAHLEMVPMRQTSMTSSSPSPPTPKLTMASTIPLTAETLTKYMRLDFVEIRIVL